MRGETERPGDVLTRGLGEDLEGLNALIFKPSTCQIAIINNGSLSRKYYCILNTGNQRQVSSSIRLNKSLKK